MLTETKIAAQFVALWLTDVRLATCRHCLSVAAADGVQLLLLRQQPQHQQQKPYRWYDVRLATCRHCLSAAAADGVQLLLLRQQLQHQQQEPYRWYANRLMETNVYIYREIA